MNLKEFHLSGKKTQLGLQTGFFFLSRNCETLLDGEGGQSRMKLPPISLSSQFRQVFIQTPDQSPIIQAALLSKGFGSPKSLTASLLAIVETFYKITSGGFRLIPKFSIIREIFSRLPDGAKIEQSHIGKKHALNTSCFWGSTRSNITSVVLFHEIFVTKIMNKLIYYHF